MTKTTTSPCSLHGNGPGAKSSSVRASKAGPLRTAVLVGVHVLFALHLAHLYTSGSSITPLEPSEAMEFSKHTVVNAGLILLVLLILSTLLLGRWFCGWGCHLVAMQDGCRWIMMKLGITPKPLRSRLLAFVPLIAAFYMFAMPYLARIWSGHEVGGMQLDLTTDPRGFWETFPGWGISITTFAVCGFATIYVMGAKGFCTYGCPYGALFGVADKVAPGRIRVTDACEGCGHCTQVCSSNVAVSREVREFGMVVDPGCMKCMDCVSVCPKDALYFGFGKPSLFARARVQMQKRRPALGFLEEGVLGLVFAGSFFALRGLWVTPREKIPFLMALGLAGCVAVLALMVVRLVKRPKVSLQNLTLKDGSLTPRGKRAVALMVFVFLTTAYAGYVNWLDAGAEKLAAELHPWKTSWFAPDRPEMDEATRARMEELRDRSLDLRRASLLESPLNPGRLAWTHQWLGEDDAVDPLLRQGLERHPGDAFLHFLRGHRSAQAGDMQLAGASFFEAADLRPDIAPFVGAAAEFLFQIGEGEAALTLLDRGREHHPGNVALSANRAFLLMALGRGEEADAAFAATMALNPTDLVLRSRWAQLRFTGGDVDGALQILQEGVLLLPDHPDSHGIFADALLSAGRAEEALAEVQRALELAPDRPDLLQVEAGARAALGQ